MEIKSQISTSEILYFVYEYLSIKINRKGNTRLIFLRAGNGAKIIGQIMSLFRVFYLKNLKNDPKVINTR